LPYFAYGGEQMDQIEPVKRRKSTLGSFMTGLLIGSITASIVSLLTAPQSGMDTRRMLREKSELARDKTVQAFENTRNQVNTLVSDTRQRADQVMKRIGGNEEHKMHPVTHDSD
jgi:gas vesicle protein